MNTTDCWHAVQLFIPLQKTTQAIMYTTLTISKTVYCMAGKFDGEFNLMFITPIVK